MHSTTVIHIFTNFLRRIQAKLSKMRIQATYTKLISAHRQYMISLSWAYDYLMHFKCIIQLVFWKKSKKKSKVAASILHTSVNFNFSVYAFSFTEMARFAFVWEYELDMLEILCNSNWNWNSLSAFYILFALLFLIIWITLVLKKIIIIFDGRVNYLYNFTTVFAFHPFLTILHLWSPHDKAPGDGSVSSPPPTRPLLNCILTTLPVHKAANTQSWETTIIHGKQVMQ